MSLLKAWVPAKDYCKHLAGCSLLARRRGVGEGSRSSPRRVAALVLTLTNNLLTGNGGNAATALVPETSGGFWFSHLSDQEGITESQSPSMAGVGRDPWGSPSPTPCPSRVTRSTKGLRAHLLGAGTAAPRPRGWTQTHTMASIKTLWAWCWVSKPRRDRDRDG